jgi:hypothetical protein
MTLALETHATIHTLQPLAILLCSSHSGFLVCDAYRVHRAPRRLQSARPNYSGIAHECCNVSFSCAGPNMSAQLHRFRRWVLAYTMIPSDADKTTPCSLPANRPRQGGPWAKAGRRGRDDEQRYDATPSPYPQCRYWWESHGRYSVRLLRMYKFMIAYSVGPPHLTCVVPD